MNTFIHRYIREWFVIGVALIISLAGCWNNPTPGSASSVSSLTPPSPNLTFAISSTGTLSSSEAATLLPIVTASLPAPTPTAIPTPLAPLTEQEALTFTLQMQETNGGCDLPCWWGIRVGETSRQDAKQMLSPLKNFQHYFEYGINPIVSVDELQLNNYSNMLFDLETLKDGQTIRRVNVSSFIPVNDETKHYDKSWQRYFVGELLSRLGKPSEVWLGFGPYGPQGNKKYLYELKVFYEVFGLIAEYAGPAIKGDPDRACLELGQLKILNLNIQSTSASNLIRPPGPGEPFTEMRPISEVTNLTPENFYGSFKSSSEQTCIESPAKYWP